MKKGYFFILFFVLTLFLSGCLQTEYEAAIDFAVNSWSSSIGAVDDGSLDDTDRQRFSFKFTLDSQTGRLNEVKSVEVVVSDSVSDRIIDNAQPYLNLANGFIEIEWYAIADTSGLGKEQILIDFNSLVTALVITLEDDSLYIVELMEPHSRFYIQA